MKRDEDGTLAPLDCTSARAFAIDDALGQASPELAARAREHVESCVTCREESAALRSTVEMLRREPALLPSPRFHRRLTTALDEVDRARDADGAGERTATILALEDARRRRSRWVAAAAAAALVVALGGSAWWIHERGGSSDDGAGLGHGVVTTPRRPDLPNPDGELAHGRPGAQPPKLESRTPDSLLDDVEEQNRRNELDHLGSIPPARRPDPVARGDAPLLPTPPRVVRPAPPIAPPEVVAKTPVERALEWLARNQRSDGSWTPGEGEPGLDTGVTALALLAFESNGRLGSAAAGAGAAPDDPLRSLDGVVDRAVAYLVGQQDGGDGTFRGGRDAASATFCHSVACLALVEHHVRCKAAGVGDANQWKEQELRLERALTRLEILLDGLLAQPNGRCAGQNAAWAALAWTTARHSGVDFHLKPTTDARVTKVLDTLRETQPDLVLVASQTVVAMADREGGRTISPTDQAWARVVRSVLGDPARVEPSLRFLVTTALYEPPAAAGSRVKRGDRLDQWNDFETTLRPALLKTQSEKAGFFDSGVLWDCYGGGVVYDTALAVLTLDVRERRVAWNAAASALEAKAALEKPARPPKRGPK